jgi:L-threonylcarbamoyladenylate synthase
MTARVVPDDAAGRAQAIEALCAGGVVAIPTDTVYGVGVSLATPDGIERLFHVKQRPPEKGIALLIGDVEQAGELGVLTPAARALAAALWPGGLTLVLAQRAGIALPEALTGGATTVGLRVPDHPAPRALARALGPMPVTSANVSGQPEAATTDEILALLGAEIDLILDGGPARGGPASTVVDVSGERPRVLREGAIPRPRLAEALAVAGLADDID